MITIVIPAAGNGSRFAECGYEQPKPMIPVIGKPMLQRVVDNLRPISDHRFVVVSKLDSDDVKPLFGDSPGINVELLHDTEGAVDTILKAKAYVEDGPVLIGNCDQLCDFDPTAFIASACFADGSLITFKSNKTHHSYVRTDNDGIITTIAEKRVISNQAVAGIYYFRSGAMFVEHAEKVVANGERYNGEFYVSLVIESMMGSGARFTAYDAPSCMLGTPEELQLFEMAVHVAGTL